MRLVCLLLCVAALAAACSSSETPKFTLAGARVDAVHWCPAGAVDAKYDVHATIDARNTTSKAVTIDAATAEMVLSAVNGKWLEPVGERYDAGAVVVNPSTVAAHSSAKLAVTIPSSCTSGAYGGGQTNAGSYTVNVNLTTSAGAFTIAAANRHEILAG